MNNDFDFSRNPCHPALSHKWRRGETLPDWMNFVGYSFASSKVVQCKKRPSKEHTDNTQCISSTAATSDAAMGGFSRRIIQSGKSFSFTQTFLITIVPLRSVKKTFPQASQRLNQDGIRGCWVMGQMGVV